MKIIIKRAKYRGQDSQMFRAYDAGTLKPLGISASTTGGTLVGVQRCAGKAFTQLVEPQAERDEIETRIRLKEISSEPAIWAAELGNH